MQHKKTRTHHGLKQSLQENLKGLFCVTHFHDHKLSFIWHTYWLSFVILVNAS